MRKKLLTLASAAALFSNVSFVKADTLNWGGGIDGGLSFMGASSEAGTTKSDADMTINWNPNFFVGYDFGDDNAEVFGVELSAGFGGRGLKIKGDEKNPISKESPLEVSLMGVTAGLAAKGMFARFEGGNMFVKLGADMQYAIIKTVKALGVEPKTDAEKKKANENIKDINVAPKLVVGVDILDGGMSLGLGAKYWMMNQADESKESSFKTNKVNLGSGQIDANLFVSVNVAKLIA